MEGPHKCTSFYKKHYEAEKSVGDHNVLSVDFFQITHRSIGNHYLQVMVIYILTISHIHADDTYSDY